MGNITSGFKREPCSLALKVVKAAKTLTWTTVQWGASAPHSSPFFREL